MRFKAACKIFFNSCVLQNMWIFIWRLSSAFNDDNGDDDDNDDNGDDDDAVEGFCSGCRARFSTERLLLHWISPHLAHHLLSALYIYLYLFFTLYLNLLLQGISLHLPYHLLSSFMLSPPTDWD